MKHRMAYELIGPSHERTYRATCTCGEWFESFSAMDVSHWGPAHVAAALDAEDAER